MKSRADAARSNRADSSNSNSRDGIHAIADVVVIGGGIVGGAAALAAAQAGLSTVWVAGPRSTEAASTDVANDGANGVAPRDLRVYALSPSTQRFLERLRIWARLDASRIAPVFDMRVFGDADSRATLHFGAYEAGTERLATIVEHRELARVLDAAAAFFPGIERIDAFASSVSVDADRVTVGTARGARQARVVIAADGARSSTRDALGIATQGRPYGQRALVGNFACARAHAGTAFQWFTDEGVIALLPLADGAPGHAHNYAHDHAQDRAQDHAVSLVWSAPDAVADRLMGEGAAAIASRLSALVGEKPRTAIGPLTTLGPIVEIPLSMQTADRMIAARAALVGDAAHIVHPLAGQGLNLGLADVETLLDVLTAREPFRECGDPVLLRRYERARAEPVMAMRRMTDGLARLFESGRPEVARVRALGMTFVDRLPPLKRSLMRRASGGA